MSNKRIDKLCPSCYSTTRILPTGGRQCTGDRLQAWTKEFNKFDNLSSEEKVLYLEKVQDKKAFLELYNRRENPECSYDNEIVLPEQDYNIRVPDPMAVKFLERKLNRKLKDYEKEENFEFYTNGTEYFDKQLTGTKPYYLEFIDFPDDC